MHNVIYTEITQGKLGQIVCIETVSWQSFPIDNGDLTGNFEWTGAWLATSYHCYNMADNTGGFAGGGGDTDGPIDAPSNSGTSGGQSGGGSISTTPIALTSTQEGMVAFMHDFTDRQLDWYNNQDDATLNAITNYLDQNGFSPESTLFVYQCINQMINNSNVFTSLNPFIIEKNIDDSALDDCTKGILTQLRGLQQNDIAKIFSKLGPTNSIYKVEITSSSILPADILGLTDWSAPTNATVIPPYEYTIELNTPELLVGGTKLGIASTILHELVHAYFLSLVDDNYMTGNSTLSTFPLLWNFYVGTNNSGANIAQHNQMANSFVNAIACSLQEFQTGIPVALNGQPDQIYKDLAWGGLEDTPPFIALSQIEKDRILAVNLAETTNATQNANSSTYNPISQPCN